MDTSTASSAPGQSLAGELLSSAALLGLMAGVMAGLVTAAQLALQVIS